MKHLGRARSRVTTYKGRPNIQLLHRMRNKRMIVSYSCSSYSTPQRTTASGITSEYHGDVQSKIVLNPRFLVRRAPNLASSLEVEARSRESRLLHAPTQQNLGRLEFPCPSKPDHDQVDPGFCVHTYPRRFHVETFLAALEICPDLESPRHTSAGPGQPEGN